MLGFAFSWACGDLWFLAQLFVSPKLQGTGIGNELIQKTFQHAEKAGATNRALITFAFNRVSQGLYIRHGMFPRTPVYFVAGPSDRLPQGDRRLRAVPIENSPAHLRMLGGLDAEALGTSREKHHKFLLGDPANKGWLFYDGGSCIGYAYAANGHVGPAAAVSRDLMEPVFRTALGLAADGGSARVSAFIPGSSQAVLSSAMALGMRITFPMLLMSSKDFGDWSTYLPRNPGFM
jgi:hypothetical protein